MLGKWECCWCELRPSLEGTCEYENSLYYCSPRNHIFKRISVSAIRREPSLNSAGGLVLSLKVPERKGRVLIAAPSHDVQDELMRIISSRVQPPALALDPKTEPADCGAASPKPDAIDALPFGWRTPFLPQIDCWSGWLLKRSRGPLASWKRRWFELCRQPPPAAVAAAGRTSNVALLQWEEPPSGHASPTGAAGQRRLEVAGVRREPGLDGPAGAVLSVEVPGRRGRTLLAAASPAEAEAAVRALARRLRTAADLAPLMGHAAAAAAAGTTGRARTLLRACA